MIDEIGQVFVTVGALLAALSALGVLRFPTLLQRMHALTKAATGGIVFALVGTALALRTTPVVTTAVLAIALQLFTFPVGANLVAHAVYKRNRDADRRSGGPEPYQQPSSGTGGPAEAATSDDGGPTGG